MQIVFQSEHPLLDQCIAGITVRDRLATALEPLGIDMLPNKAVVQPDSPLLWIQGIFPLLTSTHISQFLETAASHETCFLPATGSTDQGLLYVKHPQCDSTSFAEVARSAVRLAREPFGQAVHPIADARDALHLQTLALKNKAANLIAAGVLITAPEHVFIEETVTAESGTVIGPNVTLSGRTHLGSNCRVESGSCLRDVQVAANAVIKPYCVIEDAQIGAGASVGPFAHVRPGSQLGPNTKVGNFVETKKAVLGEGTKASHLAYLGDAVIGKDCNIGAGTITCNYDGLNKHITRLGDGVFIGSDSQLVAPVTLGNGSYVAAGSTVTRNVPEDGLAISRSKQVNKDGYAEVVRKRAQRKKESKGH